MSLRKKTVLTLGIVTLIFSGLLMMVVHRVLLSNYDRLQNQNTRHNTEMIRESCLRELEQLQSAVEDWGYWDDTYRFALEQNPDYIERNLTDSVFDNMEWSFFAILSYSDELIYLQQYDLETQTRSSPDPKLENWLMEEAVLRPSTRLSTSRMGVVVLGEQAMMAAIAPILTSLETGPDAGKLVLGRALALPAETDGQSTAWVQIDDPGLSPELRAVQNTLADSDNDIFVNPLSRTRIAGYFTLPGLNYQPALLVDVESDRAIYYEGLQTIALLLALYAVLGVVFGGVILFALEKNILSRLNVVYSKVRAIGENRDFSRRIHLGGGDELTELAERIDEAMAALQTTTDALTENEERFQYEALHDSLTGLPNRDFFLQELERAIETGRDDPGRSDAVLLVNLDRFKLINDSFNHEVGDEVLVTVRDRIRSTLRTKDCLARLTNDEFAVLLENIEQQKNATDIASRIHRQLMAPFHIQEHHLFLTASIGIAFTASGLNAVDVLRNADIATNYAKTAGRSQYAIYSPSMFTSRLHQLKMESDLLQALENHEFILHYQPVVSLKNGLITGVEALIRWQHPEMGLLYPGDFIPIAEQSGLILPISRWVLQTACRQLVEWQAFSPAQVQVAVNLSARELQDQNFLVLAEQELINLEPGEQSLQIEITETTGMADIDLATNALTYLNGLGAQIAIDDFGTGYSTLDYLTRFPASTLKIDRSFIRAVEQNPQNQAIVSATIAMAQALGMKVVAEGVETYQEMEFLHARGCDMAQGFFFSHPVPAEIISDYLQKQKRLLTTTQEQPDPREAGQVF